MNRLDELMKTKELLIHKLENTTNEREIESLNNAYIVLMSMIFQEKINATQSVCKK